MTNLNTICHRDGTVTYWSVYERVWKRRVHSVPLQELACMNGKEYRRVQKHLRK